MFDKKTNVAAQEKLGEILNAKSFDWASPRFVEASSCRVGSDYGGVLVGDG